MSVSFGWPIALVLLLLCPLIVLLARKSRRHASRGRLRFVTATRVACVALIVLAIADLRLERETDELAVTTIVDRSASISAAERAAIDQKLSALRSRTPGVRFDWVLARGEEDGVRAEGAGGPVITTADGALARAIHTAVATAPSDRIPRILVATDGRDASADLRAAVLAARRAGAEVSVLPVGDSPAIDAIAVTELDVPRLVRAGETVDIGVTLSASGSYETELEASIDGEHAAGETVTTRAGTSTRSLSITFPEEEGVHVLAVRASTSGDVVAENDRFETRVRVLSHPRVLLVHDGEGDPPALSEVLSDADLTVEAHTVAEVPDDVWALDRYALVVLDEVNPGDLSEEQQHAIRGFVEELGGGLIDATGTHAVRRQPEILREIEPVQPPPAIPEPRPLELVLVIDRSSSMDGSPMARARQAGISAVRALREDALVGVVGFSHGADFVMSPVPEDRFEEATGFISRITAGGGTDIGLALAAARRVMSHDERYIHHVILLSDGESDPASALSNARALAGSGVTISAITLGPRSQLMAEIARIGRGRYHVTRNAGSLPSLFVREAQYRQPPAHRQVRFVPSIGDSHPMTEGIDFASSPPLYGHTLAEPKPGAARLLGTSDGNALLAHWHRGLGQVATFASATTGGWANEWRAWPGFRTFWSQASWSMVRGRTVDPLDVHVRAVRGEPALREVIVVAPTVASEVVPVVQITRDADTEGLPVDPIGPGIFRAVVPVERGFLVDARMPGEPEPTAAAGADAPYPAELSSFGADLDRLRALADLGGGRVLPEADGIVEEVEPRSIARPLRLALLALALLSYLVGLLFLRLPDHHAAIAIPSPTKAPKKEPPSRPFDQREAA